MFSWWCWLLEPPRHLHSPGHDNHFLEANTLNRDLAEKIYLEKFLSVRVLRMLVCSILGTVKVREAQSRNRLSIRPGDRVRESIFHQKTKQWQYANRVIYLTRNIKSHSVNSPEILYHPHRHRPEHSSQVTQYSQSVGEWHQQNSPKVLGLLQLDVPNIAEISWIEEIFRFDLKTKKV